MIDLSLLLNNLQDAWILHNEVQTITIEYIRFTVLVIGWYKGIGLSFYVCIIFILLLNFYKIIFWY
jgi:hypothetical protein